MTPLRIVTSALLTFAVSTATGQILLSRFKLGLDRAAWWFLSFVTGSACLSALIFLALGHAPRHGGQPGALRRARTARDCHRPGALQVCQRYMSPGQAKAKPVDRRADIWAFGVVLVEMLTARPVFKSG